MVKRSKLRNNGRYIGLCPGHEDRNPSLTWWDLDGGGVAFKCFGGCSTQQVLKGLGLKWQDVAPKSGEAAVYDYGAKQKVRGEGKKFYIEGNKEAPNVPYRLDEVRRAVEEGEAIWIVEGERDVEVLRSCGVVATTFGGSNNMPDSWEDFHGASCIIAPDNDAPGGQWAKLVMEGLADVGADFLVVRPRGKDMREHVEAGYALEDVAPVGCELIRADAVAPEEVEWLWKPYIPRREITILYGDSGIGKSFMSADIAARLSAQGERVLMFCYEDPPFVVRKRIEAAGGALHNVHFAAPEWTLPSGFPQLRLLLRFVRPSFIVVDPFPTMMSASLDWYRDTVVKRVLTEMRAAFRSVGATALLLGHTAKKSEDLKQSLLGSAGQIGVARSALCVIADGCDRKVIHTKCNWSAPGGDLWFRIEDDRMKWFEAPDLGRHVEVD